MSKRLLVTAILATATVAPPALAEWSGSYGFVSEYIFRGIPQKTSSGSVGVEYGQQGWTVGTWLGDVGDGLEVDLYGSYGGSLGANDEFGYSVGVTGYFYTGDFDDTYVELNLGGSYGIASLDIALGEYENFGGPTQDYGFAALTLSAPFGGYATLASFFQDFDGEYLELGYGKEVAKDVELSIALIFSNDDLLGGQDDENVVLGISKAFDFKK